MISWLCARWPLRWICPNRPNQSSETIRQSRLARVTVYQHIRSTNESTRRIYEYTTPETPGRTGNEITDRLRGGGA